jgi:quinoprotein glucose dehydrogenase
LAHSSTSEANDRAAADFGRRHYWKRTIKYRSHGTILTLAVVLVGAALGLLTGSVGAQAGAGEWRAYAADKANSRYSPLDQINRDTASRLRVAWRQSVLPPELRKRWPNGTVPNVSQNTPLMADGLLYVSTAVGVATALDPATGEVVWFDVPPDRSAETTAAAPGALPPGVPGRTSRGLAYWTDGRDPRIIALTGQYLVALNARTGKRYPEFGGTGTGDVDLSKGYDRPAPGYRWGGPPLVVGDVIVLGGLGGQPGENTGRQQGNQGDIRGYDVRTGKLLWKFRTVPRPGEFGNETWQKDSWSYSGDVSVWGQLAADEELGYVYAPIETPNNNYYGGARPGSNLFAESLICLDARTGKRVWHFQAVHHGIWDWDFNSPPALLDITVNGRRIRAVAEVSKQNFVYVFDRATGEPVWPIEERPVPKGNVPGELYSPTQPFPTRPPPFDQQGVTVDDLVDFTPELRQEALAIVSQYHYGPLFIPPTVAGEGGRKGYLQMPGTVSTLWNSPAFDPETGLLYVPSVQRPLAAWLEPPKTPGTDVAYVLRSSGDLFGPRGLPTPFKPPYGRLTAIDLNRGETAWMIANGDGPRRHPALQHLNLPPLGQGGRVAPLVTKTLVFMGEGTNDGVIAAPPGYGGKIFRAFDKATGRTIWEMELPGGVSGAPMTYLHQGKQYIVVAIGWKDMPAEWIAMSLG